MEGREWRMVPYLSRKYMPSHDRQLYLGYDYYNDNIIGTPGEGDVEVIPERSYEDPETVRAKSEDNYDCCWLPGFVPWNGLGNQTLQDNNIIYERHNKGIPLLHILDVKRHHGSEDHVKYSWKLDEATKECKLEIDKKTVKFSLATNETDKLLSLAVDGYDVEYMLRSDAMRLSLELEIVISTPDFSDVCGEVKLEIEPDCKPYTIALLGNMHASKKPKLDPSVTYEYYVNGIVPVKPSATYKYSVTGSVPRNKRRCMYLVVKLKNCTGSLDVERRHPIFMYNIPVDQYDYIHFKNGHIRLDVIWGCSLDEYKGVCTGVCTCEPAGEFIGFQSPGEVGCSSTAEE